MSATLNLVHDTRFAKKSGKYPVKLSVTFERKTHQYQTIYDLAIEDWNKLNASRLSDSLQTVRKKLERIETESRDFASKIDSFSFEEFERGFILNNVLFKQRKRKKAFTPEVCGEFDFAPYEQKFPILKENDLEQGTIGYTYRSYVKRLIQEERVGTAYNYLCGYNSLKIYSGNVKFYEITPSYLRQYELWMLKKGREKTTVGIHLRGLRAMFNEAIHEKLVHRDKYPFGRRKYIIPTGKNNKRAFPIDLIKKIYYYIPESCEHQRKAKDYWLLLYLANGMNPKDVALLKYKNIVNGFIKFERAKTEWTSRNDPKTISVYITEDIASIIERRGNKDKSPNNYIFPILEPGITPLRQIELIQYFVKFVNRWMAKICENLGFDKEATTMVARHSFATILKNSGATTEYIKESLGHANVKTTENYLASFDDDTKKEHAAKLTAFKKEGALKAS